jgi:hypothetical protein
MATSYQGRMFDMVQEWAVETGADTIDLDPASDWALATGRYQRIPISQKQQCMQDMRRALQQSTYQDPQGNKVRTMHAVRNYKGQQMTLWIDVRTAKPDLMQQALKQTHDGIANDVRRHAIEKQSYDLNNAYGTTLEDFDYDFTWHAEDARASGEYDDTYYDGDFDEDDLD